jgi:hypothetical protein
MYNTCEFNMDLCDILHSQDFNYEDDSLLGYSAV